MTMKHAVVTEEALAELRSRIGIERRYPRQYNYEATIDTIRHYIDGIGDLNPLWRSEEYAKKTRYGCIVAPPCFLYSCGRGGGRGGLPGIHSFWSGDDWEFYRPVLVDDKIKATSRLVDIIEKPSRFAGRMFQQIADSLYYNQRDELVAICRSWGMRVERAAGRDTGKYSHLTKHSYTDEELKAIDEAYQRQQARGANPRYWEDVQVGEEIPTIIKGPLTATDIIAWLAGIGSEFLRAHDAAWAYFRRHPGAKVPDPETNVPDFPARVHWEEPLAKEVGVPTFYDIGGQRICWLSQLMTNWAGDDGFLKKLRVELRLFNLAADTQWLKGKVTNKYTKDGEHLVDCEIWAENQRGEVTAPGTATVALPSRVAGSLTFPLKGEFTR